jgi:hypothetical protein
MSVYWTKSVSYWNAERPATPASWPLTVAAVHCGPRNAIPVAQRDWRLLRQPRAEPPIWPIAGSVRSIARQFRLADLLYR